MRFIVFGGGGKVSRHFARLASAQGHHVVPIVRDETHIKDLTSLGAEPTIHSIETSSVSSLTTLLTSHSPDVVIFSAGAGGKGGPDRTRAVDFEAAVKVWEACEGSGVKRVVLVGAVDVRDRSKEPSWYNDADFQKSDSMWSSIGTYMQAKYDAELDLHSRKLDFTVVRPGPLTEDPAGGCELGLAHITSTSRELVAQVVLAVAQEPRTAGLSIDVMDGSGSVQSELTKVVEAQTDAWIG